jgi:hypothetical protein
VDARFGEAGIRMGGDVAATADFVLETGASGQTQSIRLYGRELLDQREPCRSELWVNGLPLALRTHTDPHDPTRTLSHLKGERWVDHFSGWALVLARTSGERPGVKHRCVGITTLIRREPCDQTLPIPGPGGPPIEAPLYVDSFSLLNWNWNFWGDDTRMIFPSSHSNGPTEEWGHCGHEHDTPENAKKFLNNVWRRIYPGCLVVHGGVFYDAKSGNWLAITCRRPQVGYILNISDAGRGIGYDFTLHAPFAVGESLQLPEIKIYYGPDRASMMSWLGDYVSFYYEEPPAWFFRTVWGEGLSWNNQPTWTGQADYWEKRLATGELSGIGYSLVTNRPVHSGTTPTGYEPDPNHGTQREFKAMCRRLADKGVPLLIWMSHSGLLYQGGADIDDDWFIYGIDGRPCASWGSIDQGGLTHINPGHPGYIEYTRKWVQFYIGECGCKGIFFDCYSWAFPPDFRPRPWMRYPGDTNRMAVTFAEALYAEIKRCDPEAILLGEGWASDLPANVFSIHANPVRAASVDGLGPRDFLLQLNTWSPKRLTIDQAPTLNPGAGFTHIARGSEWAGHNRYLTQLLKTRGMARAFIPLPGDLSILPEPDGGGLLFVPVIGSGSQSARDLTLPTPWNAVRELREELDPARCITRDPRGLFRDVMPGIYRLQKGE